MRCVAAAVSRLCSVRCRAVRACRLRSVVRCPVGRSSASACIVPVAVRCDAVPGCSAVPGHSSSAAVPCGAVPCRRLVGRAGRRGAVWCAGPAVWCRVRCCTALRCSQAPVQCRVRCSASAVLGRLRGGTVAAVTCALSGWCWPAVPPAVLMLSCAASAVPCGPSGAVRCSVCCAVVCAARGASARCCRLSPVPRAVSRPVPLVVPCAAVCGAVLSAPAHRRVPSAVPVGVCGAAPADAVRSAVLCSAVRSAVQ